MRKEFCSKKGCVNKLEVFSKRYCRACSAQSVKDFRAKSIFGKRAQGIDGKCKCGNEKLPGRRYCNPCKNIFMKNWRKKNSKVSDSQKFKSIVRSKTKMRVRRGLLKKYPCEVCGDIKVEAHHDDYNKPYDVRWLCFKHHREHHAMEKINA